jgi:hypothetical protein
VASFEMLADPPGWRGNRIRNSSPRRNSEFVEPLDGNRRTGASA